MIIRAQQMQVLANYCRDQANHRLADYARKRFPDILAQRDHDTLLRYAETVRSSAERYGFERDDHVATWLDLMAMYGFDFPESPWAAPILQNRRFGPEGTIQALKQEVRKVGGQI